MNDEDEKHEVEVQFIELSKILSNLVALNLPDSTYRSRELSIAITQLETGCLWLREAIK